jgi:uncharacterized membrane protein
MDGYALLIAACATFVGTHFLMSHPLRAGLVERLGGGGFAGFYSLVSLASFGWMIWAWRGAPTSENVWMPTDPVWAVASLLTLFGAVFFAGSLIGNPAFPNPEIDEVEGRKLAAKSPSGMFLVTRHPMMWGFALWGIAHILVAPRIDSFIFVGSIIFLALVGAKAQEAKKARALGTGWVTWESRTSYWPRLSSLSRIGWRIWAVGITAWLIATWAHNFFGAYDAGIFRWL